MCVRACVRVCLCVYVCVLQFDFLDSDKGGNVDTEEFMLFKGAQMWVDAINEGVVEATANFRFQVENLS